MAKQFKNVNAVYTGGGIWLFYGQYGKDYFLAGDEGDVTLLDSDPSDLDESLYAEWQEKHLIAYLDGEERVTFCDKLAERLLRQVSGDHRGGITDEEIKHYKSFWRLPM